MTVLLGSLPAGGKSFAIVQPLSDDLRPEERAAHAAAEAKIGGSAAAGRELFYDDAEPEECAICHTYRGRGGTIGPDLTGMSDRSPDEILERITKPRSAGEGRYVTVVLTTRDGQRYVGIKRDENKERIRVYDASSMPPVSRAFQKSDIVEVNVLDRSVMPADYASRYSQKQLLDLVAFLKLGAPIPKINNDPN